MELNNTIYKKSIKKIIKQKYIRVILARQIDKNSNDEIFYDRGI